MGLTARPVTAAAASAAVFVIRGGLPIRSLSDSSFSPPSSAALGMKVVGGFSFQETWFLLDLTMSPIPSKTFVTSYIRRFCTPNSFAA